MEYPINLPYKIILGSQSPRRKQLLEGMGIEFEVKIIPTDESFDTTKAPVDIASSIAIAKATCFKDLVSDGKHLVITADTIVSIDHTILNKPTDTEDAVRMIKMLSGNKHKVYTGVCIATHEGLDFFVEGTDVYFNELTEKEIRYYIETCKPFDKAGSYGVQEWIGYVGIKKIEGCFFNVMGLPVNELYKRLKKYSVDRKSKL
jgi:septum formation protein